MICIGGRKTWSGVYVYIYFFIMSLGKAILRKIMYCIPDGWILSTRFWALEIIFFLATD